jgi:hypothetical protein
MPTRLSLVPLLDGSEVSPGRTARRAMLRNCITRGKRIEKGVTNCYDSICVGFLRAC